MNKPNQIDPNSDAPVYARNYCIYKPNPRGSGSALRFNLNQAKGSLFIEAANQLAEKQFDWENKVIMKWNLEDLGSVLSVIKGSQPSTKLFHQSEKATSVFELTRRNEADRAPYFATLSRKSTDDQSLSKIAIPLNESEAAILSIALSHAVVQILRW